MSDWLRDEPERLVEGPGWERPNHDALRMEEDFQVFLDKWTKTMEEELQAVIRGLPWHVRLTYRAAVIVGRIRTWMRNLLMRGKSK